MDDVHVPLLSPKTEGSVPVNDSPVCMPSDRQQHYKNPSIYRVPAYITSLNTEAYQPQVVSFGPYDYDKAHLFPMEEHKHRVLSHFLKRSGKSQDPFLESLREVAQELEESYDRLDGTEPKGDEFLKLMIRDGCFMLQIMRETDGENRDYEPNDPIFSIQRLKYIKPYIRRDMLLLENQLPMEVLYRLVKVENNGQEHIEDVNELVLRFHGYSEETRKGPKCLDWLPIFRVSPAPDPPSLGKGIKVDRCLHVLDVFRKGLLTEPEKNQHEVQTKVPEAAENQHEVQTKKPKASEDQQEVHIWPATELKEAGIVFKTSKTKSLKDISFSKGRGVLWLPVVTVDDTTESKFLNIMTFERLHIGVEVKAEVTSYVAFIDKIINDERDVELLHTNGIIQNDIGSNEAVAKLFNSLCKEVTLVSTPRIVGVQQEMRDYCEKLWNKWRAKLWHTYFTSPWSVLSLIAAVLLFVLTALQTVYTLLSYF